MGNDSLKDQVDIALGRLRLWRSVRCRARRLGLPFDLEPYDIVIPECCPVLGIPLQFAPKGRTSNTPSIDRRDPAKGYTKDNIKVISWRANRLKSDASLEELFQLYTHTKGQEA